MNSDKFDLLKDAIDITDRFKLIKIEGNKDEFYYSKEDLDFWITNQDISNGQENIRNYKHEMFIHPNVKPNIETTRAIITVYDKRTGYFSTNSIFRTKKGFYIKKDGRRVYINFEENK
jgi:hypothetical protein